MGFEKGKLQTKKFLWELGNQLSADSYAATGTIAICSLPANTQVMGVKAHVLTAVTGATSEIVGDGTDTNGYLEDGFAASTGLYPLHVNDSGTTFSGLMAYDENAGGTDAADVNRVPKSKHYTSADTIDFVIGGTATAGKIMFYVDFLVLA